MQRVTIVRGIYSTQRSDKSYPPKGNEQQTLLDHQFFLSVEVRTSLSQQDPDSWNCVVRQLKHEQTGYTRMLLTTGEHSSNATMQGVLQNGLNMASKEQREQRRSVASIRFGRGNLRRALTVVLL